MNIYGGITEVVLEKSKDQLVKKCSTLKVKKENET